MYVVSANCSQLYTNGEARVAQNCGECIFYKIVHNFAQTHVAQNCGECTGPSVTIPTITVTPLTHRTDAVVVIMTAHCPEGF